MAVDDGLMGWVSGIDLLLFLAPSLHQAVAWLADPDYDGKGVPPFKVSRELPAITLCVDYC